MSPIETQKTIGPYQVLDVVGHGGMATVYKALEPQLDRIVAIKVLLPALAQDAAFRSRFRREAQLVARLKHPNIVGIYGVGEDQGMPYLVMEYLQGTTLHAVIRQRRQAGESFSPAEALDLLRPLAAALDYAHGQNIVHRDLKPENIMLTAGGPVITDFGLAKMIQDEAPTVSVIMGTPSYMAPEQIRGESVDRRTDVYALGILLYELLTGQVPFTGTSPYAVAQAHLHLPPPALSNLTTRLASMPQLESVAQRALAKGKTERWPSAGALVGAFERAVDLSNAQTMHGPPLVRHAVLPDGTRSLPPVVPPARLQRPPASDSKVGRLVLVVPLVALLLVGLWAARVLAGFSDEGSQEGRRAVVVGGTSSPEAAPSNSTAQAASSPEAAPSSPTAQAASSTPAAATTPTVTVTPDTAVRGIVGAPTGAFLRSGPGTAYPTIAGLPFGAAVTVLHQRDGWFEVAAQSGEQGWMASQLIEVSTGDVAALPSRDVAPPPTPLPVAQVTPQPQASPIAPTTAPTTAPTAAATPAPPAVVQAEGETVTLEDRAFAGGFRNSGQSIYGGRTSTWVYGQGSGYTSMGATFDIGDATGRSATLAIVGMDSEDSRKTPMRITLNESVIWEGANPLPNDDQPLPTGTWDTMTVTVPAGVLRAGANTLVITNLASGSIGRPPFIALDYATVTLQ